MKVKVTAISFGNNLTQLFDGWREAAKWMEQTDKSNVPYKFQEEFYPLKFEVESVPDLEMDAEEFAELEELVADPVIEDIPLEDVDERESE